MFESPCAGFNALFTGLVFIIYCIAALVIINKTPSTISVGTLYFYFILNKLR